MEQESGLMGC